MMRMLRRDRGLHVNPWTHFPRLITSIDFLKRERPMRLFSEVLPTEQEQKLLGQIRAWAESARYRPDSKSRELMDWLHQHIKPAGRWTDERVIIFTEYRATQNSLYGLLMLYGGMLTQDREAIKAAFQADPAQASVRILLATDAAFKGIGLQNHCSRLIHYEIPWNPNRLEQRNGRIDRHGQRAKQVNIYHFVSRPGGARQTNRHRNSGGNPAHTKALRQPTIAPLPRSHNLFSRPRNGDRDPTKTTITHP